MEFTVFCIRRRVSATSLQLVLSWEFRKSRLAFVRQKPFLLSLLDGFANVEFVEICLISEQLFSSILPD